MKKEITIHFVAFVVYFLLVTLLRRFFDLPYLLFWLGGIVGTILPDVDHFIYVYFLRPHELTSQRVQYLTQKASFWRAVDLLAVTRSERTNLIFHTAWFQIFFLLLTFWVITSSDSLFGRGLVLAFSLHLIVDQIQDLMQLDHLNNWFQQFRLNWDKEKLTLYTLVMLGVVFILGIW